MKKRLKKTWNTTNHGCHPTGLLCRSLHLAPYMAAWGMPIRLMSFSKKSYKPNEVPPFGVISETAGGRILILLLEPAVPYKRIVLVLAESKSQKRRYTARQQEVASIMDKAPYNRGRGDKKEFIVE